MHEKIYELGQENELCHSDFIDTFVCKACTIKHVKVAVIARRSAAGYSFFHVFLTSILVPLVVLIQLSAQELHAPEKMKMLVTKDDDRHNILIKKKKMGKRKVV